MIRSHYAHIHFHTILLSGSTGTVAAAGSSRFGIKRKYIQTTSSKHSGPGISGRPRLPQKQDRRLALANTLQSSMVFYWLLNNNELCGSDVKIC